MDAGDANSQFLWVLDGLESRMLRLPELGDLLVGASVEAEVRLADSRVSPSHARLVIQDGEVRIVDLATAQGIEVNGDRVTGERPLQGGDIVGVGRATLVLHGGSKPRQGVPAGPPTPSELLVQGQVVVVADPAMVRLHALITRLAAISLPLLVTGETGVGKEVAARALHDRSSRQGGPFVAVNCAALPDTLLESELFGWERGAFSGAVVAKAGLLETASGGTVFLDEIGELSLPAQAKLLRVLEHGLVTRLGGLKERKIDVRLIAATNRDLREEVEVGRFRKDLFFRLAGATLRVPPLRERAGEIVPLAERFLADGCVKARRPSLVLGPEARRLLEAYPWPGNVRELRNVMGYLAAAVSADCELVDPQHLVSAMGGGTESGPSLATPVRFRPLAEELRELERARILAALDATGGNQTRAAALLSVPLRTFFSKVRQHGLVVRRGVVRG